MSFPHFSDIEHSFRYKVGMSLADEVLYALDPNHRRQQLLFRFLAPVALLCWFAPWAYLLYEGLVLHYYSGITVTILFGVLVTVVGVRSWIWHWGVMTKENILDMKQMSRWGQWPIIEKSGFYRPQEMSATNLFAWIVILMPHFLWRVHQFLQLRSTMATPFHQDPVSASLLQMVKTWNRDKERAHKLITDMQNNYIDEAPVRKIVESLQRDETYILALLQERAALLNSWHARQLSEERQTHARQVAESARKLLEEVRANRNAFDDFAKRDSAVKEVDKLTGS
jgi:hypothetical protein